MRTTRRLTRPIAVAALIATVVASLVGCPAAEPGDPAIILDQLERNNDNVSAVWVDLAIKDALPNQEFLNLDTGESFTAGDGVVLGTVIGAKVISAIDYPDGGIDEVQLDQADPNALSRLVEVQVAVDEGWGVHEGAKTATFVVPIDGDMPIDTALASITALGRIFVILDGDRIWRNGRLLGMVDKKENVTFIGDPEMDFGPPGTDYFLGIDTLDEFRAELAEQRAVIETNDWVQVKSGEADDSEADAP